MIDKYEMKGEIKCAKSLFCQLSSSLYCLFGIPIRIPKVIILIKFQVGSREVTNWEEVKFQKKG